MMTRGTISPNIIGALAVLTFAMPGMAPQAATAERVKVAVTISPLAGVVEAIGEEAVDVTTLIKPGQSPSTYEPTPRQMTEIARCDVLFAIGDLPFEKRYLPRIQKIYPDTIIVKTAGAIPRRRMERPAEASSEHDPDDHHSHGHSHGHEGLDPHVWLAPANLLPIADTITTSLIKIQPAQATRFSENQARYRERVEGVRRRVSHNLSPYRGRVFYVFHPAFGYFADAFGLQQRAIETEGKSPSPRQLANTIREATSDQVRVIFVQPQFDSRAAQALAESIDGVVKPLDPLGHDPLASIETIAQTLREAFAAGGDSGASSSGRLASPHEHAHE